MVSACKLYYSEASLSLPVWKKSFFMFGSSQHCGLKTFLGDKYLKDFQCLGVFKNKFFTDNIL